MSYLSGNTALIPFVSNSAAGKAIEPATAPTGPAKAPPADAPITDGAAPLAIVLNPRPTFSKAVAIKLPISSSLLPEMVATALICFSSVISRASFLSSSTTNLTPLSIPFFTSTGLEP